MGMGDKERGRFSSKRKAEAVLRLQAKVGEITMENELLQERARAGLGRAWVTTNGTDAPRPERVFSRQSLGQQQIAPTGAASR